MKSNRLTPRYRYIPRSLTWLLASCLFLGSAQAANELAGHPSPYLALHGEDPVHWKSWDSRVFAEAKASKRLVFVSIGYFSCHWCHVMQQESYQDESVAEVLNQHYISVKVDRELEPELDQQLIDFVEKIRGAAGWPLNVFLTPEGYPVTGFTYLPRDNFVSVLQQLAQQWQKNKPGISKAAEEFFKREMQDESSQPLTLTEIPAERLIDAFLSQAMQYADQLQGGFGNTSKFPNAPQLGVLLDIIKQGKGDPVELEDFVNLSLQMMASRNLTDHVNGGFYRYTTDPDWATPHYEKMLYDNAQLATLYLQAHQLWPQKGYDAVALRTLDFVESSLRHPSGGYMSSLSAVDVNNKEGGAYLWTRELLGRYLTVDELKYVSDIWHLDARSSEFLPQVLVGPGAPENEQKNKLILHKLRSRGSADMPADHKRLASWNAMLLGALIQASRVDTRFKKRAEILFHNMREIFFHEGRLIRFAGNENLSTAVLEDYAFVAHAFYQYGKIFDDTVAQKLAAQLVETSYSLFLDEGLETQQAHSLIPVSKNNWIIPDSVLYSPMTLWVKVASENPRVDNQVREVAAQMPGRVTRELLNSPYYYGSFIMLRQES